MLPWLYLLLLAPVNPQRMEITVERREGSAWHATDPALVFSRDDLVRFRFRSSFDGYLYVSVRSTSGKYEQLFPRAETGRRNRIVAGREYLVPATETAFRITDPPGHEVIYWMISPAAIGPPEPEPPPPASPKILLPRCDDAVFRARGECLDPTAGPRLIPRGGQRLVFIRREQTAVISSPNPLTGPVIYEFHLAHK